MIRTLRAALAALPLLCAGCGHHTYELSSSGALASSNNLAVSSGGQVSGSELSVDLHFGTRTGGGAGREFAYFVILRPAASFTGDSEKRNAAWSNGQEARSEMSIRRGDRELSVLFTAERDAEGSAVTSALEVSLNDETLDASAGRVFLVELTGAAPTVLQLDLALPGDLPQDWDLATMRATALAAFEDLKATSAEVREFAD